MIKIAQVGLGYGQYVHIPAFKLDKRFKILAVCSKNIAKAKKVSKKYNIEYFTDNIENLFDRVDAISLAVPPKEQKKILPLLINKKIHVFFEKPLGFIPAKKYQTTKKQALVIDYQFTEIDVWKDLKNLIDKKELGKLLHVKISWDHATFAVLQKIKSWKTDIKLYGGALNNFGSHVLFYIEYLFGKISLIKAKSHIKEESKEEEIELDIILANRCIISVKINNKLTNKFGHSITITGKKGVCYLYNNSKHVNNNFNLKINLKDKKSYIIKSKFKKKNKLDQRISSVEPLVRKFGDWIELQKIQKPNLKDAIRVEYLLNKCRLSIKKNIYINV